MVRVRRRGDDVVLVVSAMGAETDELLRLARQVSDDPPGWELDMFETLAGEGINIEMISTSAIRISCVIRAADIDRAVVALHAAFELDKAPEDRAGL